VELLVQRKRIGGVMRVGTLVKSKKHHSMGVILLIDTHWGDVWVHVKWLVNTYPDPIQYPRDLEVLCE